MQASKQRAFDKIQNSTQKSDTNKAFETLNEFDITDQRLAFPKQPNPVCHTVNFRYEIFE